MNQGKIDKLGLYREYLAEASPRGNHPRLKALARALIASLPFAYSESGRHSCDVLFLHVSRAVIGRFGPLRERLTARGLAVADEVIMSAKDVLLDRYLSKPGAAIPREWRYEAAYAKYIVQRYRPRVLLTYMDSSPLSVFLREEMRPYGKVVNLAHGVTGDTYLFSMVDFDYLFLFGRRSLENLTRNPVRFGSSKVVLTGSPFITPDFVLPPNYDKKNILFFSSWIPEKYREIILNNFHIVKDWAKQHPEFHLYVKLHPSPMEEPTLWEKLSHGIGNITILQKSVDIKAALENVSLAIVAWSCASFEASILNRPTVIVNDSDMEDNFLCLEKFFLPRARSVEELHANIVTTFNNYDFYLEKSREFIRFHFEHVHDSIEYISDCIESISQGRETFPTIELHEKLATLEGKN